MAEIDTTGIEEWLDSIQRSVGTTQIVTHISLVPKTKQGANYLKRIRSQEEELADILKDFIALYIVGEKGILKQQFDQRRQQGQKYYLYYLDKDDQRRTPGYKHDTDAEGDEDADEMGFDYGDLPVSGSGASTRSLSAGFADLWAELKRPQAITIDGHSVRGGVGSIPRLVSMPLSKYTGGGGKSKYNSLFYAVEYGTGIEENVGAPGFVRRNLGVPGKRGWKEADGSWWFAKSHYIGQRGFHFLYDERTRHPIGLYEEFIQKQLPIFVKERLAGKSKDISVRIR